MVPKLIDRPMKTYLAFSLGRIETASFDSLAVYDLAW